MKREDEDREKTKKREGRCRKGEGVKGQRKEKSGWKRQEMIEERGR